MINITRYVFAFSLISGTLSLYEGDDCVVNNPEGPPKPGKCQSIHDCEYAKGLLQTVNKPQTCGFVKLDPLVCCPEIVAEIKNEEAGEQQKEACNPVPRKDFPSQNGKCVTTIECNYKKALELLGKGTENCRSNGPKPLVCCPSGALRRRRSFNTTAEKKCVDYYDKDKVIIGVSKGQKATSKEFPHMAAIGYKEGTEIEWFCGGSLISDSFVLTAAHCTYSYGLSPNLIRLGDLDLQNTTEDAAPEDFGIGDTYVHPEYKSSSHYHDIALLRLSRQLLFNPFIKPACLHVKNDLPPQLQAIGWGKTAFAGPVSSRLLKVTLNVASYRICAELYNKTSFRKLKSGIIETMQICAGGDSEEDTCPGDSGGPLHYLSSGSPKLRDHFVIAGITSFGKGCGFGSIPGVYTRVFRYISWIEGIVWPSESLVSYA